MSTPRHPTGSAHAISVPEAAAELARGNLVALPTETVYGLGADAMNPTAVARIFAAKGRPADHPLIVHLAPEASLDDWALEIPEAARKLAKAFWPGPLTMILKKSPRVPAIVTGGQDSVGLRCPSTRWRWRCCGSSRRPAAAPWRRRRPTSWTKNGR